MPDRDPPENRTLVAMSERVAVVETKVAGLKDDTQVIRANIHTINNEIMKVTAAEIRCADALEALQNILATRTAQVDKISATVDLLLIAKSAAEGAWWATVRISAAIVASISVLGSVGGVIAWSLGHVAVR